jgi:hypothetical protein
MKYLYKIKNYYSLFPSNMHGTEVTNNFIIPGHRIKFSYYMQLRRTQDALMRSAKTDCARAKEWN